MLKGNRAAHIMAATRVLTKLASLESQNTEDAEKSSHANFVQKNMES